MEDPMKPFIEGGEIIYSTKLDSLKSFGGKNRALFTWQLPANHSANKVFVYWDNEKDSAELDFKLIEGKMYHAYLEDLKERTYLFDVYSIDSKGNKSVKVITSVNSYGERYESGLQNRFVEEAIAINNDVNLSLGKADEGSIFSEFFYTNNKNQKMNIRVDKNSDVLQILDWKNGTPITYRTAFKPLDNLIDTFYTKEIMTLKVKQDVSEQYIKNHNQPFKTVQPDIGDRFRDLLNWNLNTAVQNHNGMGGWSTDVGTVIHMESGWGASDIINGKIFQVINLPKGDYSFEILIDEYGLGTSTVKLVVAPGNAIPDFNSNMEVPGVIGSADFQQSNLNFTLQSDSQVSLGFLANMIGDQYWRIKKVSLFRY